MIAYLKGKVLFKNQESIIIGTDGIGYLVFLSSNSLKRTELDETIEVFISTHLQREKIELYGCLCREEFSLFVFLEKLAGIGPKTALSLASIGSLANLKTELEKKNSLLLASIRGLGIKRKQRLIKELGSELKNLESDPLKQERLF